MSFNALRSLSRMFAVFSTDRAGALTCGWSLCTKLLTGLFKPWGACRPETQLWRNKPEINSSCIIMSLQQMQAFLTFWVVGRYYVRVCFLPLKVTRDQEKEIHQSQCGHVDGFMSTCCPDNYIWLTVRVSNESRRLASDGHCPPMASLQVRLEAPIGHMSEEPTNHVSRHWTRHLWLFTSPLAVVGCAHASFWHAWN